MQSETGGRLENLRTSCSNEKVNFIVYIPFIHVLTFTHSLLNSLHPPQVRNYHRSFYRPDNLCLIVTGQVEADALFQSLAPFEDKILTKVCPGFCGF